MGAVKRRFCLSRRGKIIRNFALALLLGLNLWGNRGYPLPTAELEFRRMERVSLFSPSEIVFATPEFYRSTLAVNRADRTVAALDGTELTLNGRWIAGISETCAVMAGIDRRVFLAVPLEPEGPTLLYFGEGNIWDAWGYWVEEGPTPSGYQYTYHNFFPLLAVNVPGETDRIELALEDDEGEMRRGSGWNLGGGIWLLGIEENDGPAGFVEQRDPRAYILQLYGGDGTLLLEQRGTMPKNG